MSQRRHIRRLLAGLLILLTLAAPCSPTPPAPYVPPPVSESGPAFPTQLPRSEQGGSDQVMTMRLPGKIDALDLAVHPISGWPAVIAWQHWSLSTDGVAAFARVYNPKARRWGPALQIDPGPTGNGADRFASAVIGITGDSAVHAVWGASDEGSAGLWTSTSTDYGETWSAAQRIATDCWFANAMATTASGWIVVQASCFRGGRADPQPDATLIVRREDGTWLPQQRSGVPGGGTSPLQLYHIQITWTNPTGADIPIQYDAQLKLRAILLPDGRLRTDSGWGISGLALKQAGLDHLPTTIPPGESTVELPILAPLGQPKIVELAFAAYVLLLILPSAAHPLSAVIITRACKNCTCNRIFGQPLTRLARCVTPLLTAIDDLLSGVPGADPAAVVQRMGSADLGLLLDLFAADPLLQRVLLDPGSMGADSAPMLWGIMADVLASLLWRLPWQKEMLRFYTALSERHLRSALHLMLTWEPPDVSGQAIADTLEHEFGRKTTILDHLPSILDGAYQVDEARARLVPEEYGRPYYTVLQSYDMRGVWDATTLHPLLSGAHDVAVAIDVQTLSRNKAMRTAELAYNTARMLAKDQQIIDMRAQRVKAAAEYVMHEVVRQSLHQVQIAVLVGGATPEELETNAQSIQERCGTQLRLMRVAGAQGELVKLFSTTPAQQIDAPWKRRDMLSHGVGCCAAIVGYHRASNTSGILYGLDAVRRAPLFFNLIEPGLGGPGRMIAQEERVQYSFRAYSMLGRRRLI